MVGMWGIISVLKQSSFKNLYYYKFVLKQPVEAHSRIVPPEPKLLQTGTKIIRKFFNLYYSQMFVSKQKRPAHLQQTAEWLEPNKLRAARLR